MQFQSIHSVLFKYYFQLIKFRNTKNSELENIRLNRINIFQRIIYMVTRKIKYVSGCIRDVSRLAMRFVVGSETL